MHYRRVYLPGGSYFFTVNLENRSSNILIKEIKSLGYAIHATKRKYPFKMPAWVILPEHFHFIMILPENDSDYSLRLGMMKSLFSRQIPCQSTINNSRKSKRERNIWQRRFWEHAIRDESDFENHVNYIHFNPVKHGYVKHAIDWKYSSIHGYIRKGILSENWGYDGDFDEEKCFGE